LICELIILAFDLTFRQLYGAEN